METVISTRCAKCGRAFPWGISASDGKCFPCRHPEHWSEKDEAEYKAKVSAFKVKPAKAEPEKE